MGPAFGNDDAIVLGLRAGRRDAFEALHATYHPAIFNLCARLLGDREEAKDVTQEVFIKAFDRLPATGEELRLRLWLFKVATNACLNQLRAAGRFRAADEADLETLPAQVDRFEQSQTAALVEETLAQLNDRYRTALVLNDLHGLPAEEVAEVLEVSRPTADVVVHRARRAFQRTFQALAATQSGHAGCGFAQQLAQSVVGRAVNKDERRQIKEHVRSCPECRGALRVGDKAAVGMGLFLGPLAVPAALHLMPPLPAAVAHAPTPPVGPGLLTKIGTGLGVKAAVTAAAVATIGGGLAFHEITSTHRTSHGAATAVASRSRAASATQSGLWISWLRNSMWSMSGSWGMSWNSYRGMWPWSDMASSWSSWSSGSSAMGSGSWSGSGMSGKNSSGSHSSSGSWSGSGMSGKSSSGSTHSGSSRSWSSRSPGSGWSGGSGHSSSGWSGGGSGW